MGLTSKTAKVKWNRKIKKHYEELGYKYTKMGEEFEVKVEDLTKGSDSIVYGFCDECKKEMDWTYRSFNECVKENGKTYCRNCAMKLYGNKQYRKSRLSNSKSFEQWCIENDRQDVLDRWDYELNDCLPSEIGYGSSKKCWFKCLVHKEHKSELKKLNSFTSGYKRVMNCKQCNSVGQYIVDNFGEEFLWKVWSDKNDKSPFEISLHSTSFFWWNCVDDKHKAFKRDCNSSVRYNFRCPKCSEERKESILEEEVRLYLNCLGFEVLTEHNCTIRPINPKTKQPLPFDNEIILENGKHLIIEVHGIQHYYFSKNSSYCKTEEELHTRQLIDRYKRIKCMQAGYEYLEIPYTAFDKKETYKILINNKIKVVDK